MDDFSIRSWVWGLCDRGTEQVTALSPPLSVGPFWAWGGLEAGSSAFWDLAPSERGRILPRGCSPG